MMGEARLARAEEAGGAVDQSDRDLSGTSEKAQIG